MAENTVTLRLTANADGVVTGVRLASTEVGKLGGAAEQAGGKAASGFGKTRAGVESVSKQLSVLKQQMLAFIGISQLIQAGRGMARMADEWSNIGAKLGLATKGTIAQGAALEAVYRVAQSTSTEMDATGNLVSRLSSNLASMGLESEKAFGTALSLAETINQTFAISGASSAAQANAITQFTQSLAGGILRAEEFNSVVGNSPRLAEAMAAGMGKSMGELRKAVNEGKVSAAEMLKAIQSQAGVVDAEFNSLPLTIERAWTQLRNSVLRYIGTADQTNGVSAKIAQGVQWVAQNIDTVVEAVLRLGAVVATVYAVQLLQAGRAWIGSLLAQEKATTSLMVKQSAWGATTKASFASAMKSMGALGIALNVLGAAVVGLQLGAYLRDNFIEARLFGIAFIDGILKGWEYIKQGALIAWEMIKAAFIGSLNVMRSALASFVGLYANAAAAIPNMFGGEKIEARLRGLQAALKPTTSATEDMLVAIEKINAEAEAARKQITATTDALVDDELAKEYAEKATDDYSASTATAADMAALLAAQLAGVATNAGKTKEELAKLKQEQDTFSRKVARETAELAGPQFVANFDLEDAKREGRQALEEGKARIEDVRQHEKNLEEQYRRTIDALTLRAAAPQALLNAMTGELELLRKIGPERELERRRLQAESEMQRALADAREAAGDAAAREQAAVANGYATWQDYEAAMLAAADANAVASMKMEEAAKQAEDWARAWLDAVDGVADAFTGFVMSGLRDFKGLAKDLKNIAKQLVGDLVRTFLQQKIVIPIQTQIMQSFSGGAGQQGFGALLNNGFDRLLGGIGKLFGRGGAAQAAIEAGTSSGMGAWTGSLVEAGSMQARALAGLPAGKAAGIGASPWMGALGGAVMGWGMGGDTLGKIGGGLAGGAVGMGAANLLAGAAFGPVGWIGLAALALNAISGGKLFGTKFSAESGAQQFNIGAGGASGYNEVTEVRQKSFFRGREWRTTQSALDAQSQSAINELFKTLQSTVETAAGQLGIATPQIVGGSFRREFDKNGNLTREFGTIAGRVYYEAQEAFAARLVGENLLAVAKAAGSATELEQLANKYRSTGEALQGFATAALAIQEDLLKANGIWAKLDGEGVMTRIVKYIEGIAKAGESLADAYARVQQTVQQYGDLIGGVRQQIATRGLNQYQKAQLDIELAYRTQVKQANELAKALGLSGARAEDLAAIEQLRALNMADLAKQYADQQKAQNQQWLADLGLSDLSPLRDDQKLAKALGMLQDAVGAGDAQRAQKLAEQVLGFGRDLYASGQDYSDLYSQVTELVGELGTKSMEELQGLTNSELANLADLVSGLPSKIAQELAQVLVGGSGTQVTPAPLPPPPAPSPVQPPDDGLIGAPGVGWKYPSADPMGVMVGEPSPYGGASNGGQVIKLLSAIAESTGALKRQGASAELAALNGWRVR